MSKSSTCERFKKAWLHINPILENSSRTYVTIDLGIKDKGRTLEYSLHVLPKLHILGLFYHQLLFHSTQEAGSLLQISYPFFQPYSPMN